MASELQIAGQGIGEAWYAVLKLADQYMNGAAAEAYNAAHWTSYAIALTDANSLGIYQGNFPAAAAGVYYAFYFLRRAGSPAIGDGPPRGAETILWGGTATGGAAATAQQIRDAMALALTGGADIQAGSLDALLAALRGKRVAASSAILSDGQLLTLVAGDDYTAAAGQALEWTDDFGVWPDLTGAAVALSIKVKNSDGTGGAVVLAKAGTVVVATGDGKTVRVEPVRVETGTLAAAERGYRFNVKVVLANGDEVTLVRGDGTVVEDES